MMNKKYKSFRVSVAVLIVITAILFGVYQHYELYIPIDTNIFGNYGDFIGGMLSVVSVFLLVETLKQQMQDSKDQQEFIKDQNENMKRQQESSEKNNFNSLFFGLLQYLQKEIEDLNTMGNEGQYTNKDYFEKLRVKLQEGFCTTDKYVENVSSAIRNYTQIYVENPRLGSYFRLLYRICQLTDEASINEELKKEYIKILRAQLTNSELLLLRYNAQTPYGENFQNYINKYNLLKHLPVFELLEFKQWWGTMEEYQRYQVSVFVDKLKMLIKKMSCSADNSSKSIDFVPWKLTIKKESDLKLSIQIVQKYKSNKDDSFFEGLSPEELQRFLQCVLSEIFSFSNFEVLKQRATLRIEGKSKPKKNNIGCCVESLDEDSPLEQSFVNSI